MLRFFQIARLAFQHSPEKEQRLLSIRSEEQIISTETDVNSGKGIPKSIARIQGETRRRLAFLNELAKLKIDHEEGREPEDGVLERFYATHQEFLDTYFKQNLRREFGETYKATTTLDSLLRIFDSDLKEIISRSLEKLGPRYSMHLTDENFLRAYMKAVLKLPLNAEITDEQMAQFEESQYVPNAFITNGTIHLNVNHEDFDFEKKLMALRAEQPSITDEEVLEIVEKNRERALIHEIGHYCLDRKDRDVTRWSRLQSHLKNSLRVKKLSDHPAWTELQQAVEEHFDGKFGEKSDVKYLHEAIAIWTAGKRRPLEKGDKERAVLKKFDALLAATSTNPFVRQVIDEFERDVQEQIDGDGTRESSFHFARRKMDGASAEREENLAFKRDFEEHGCDTFTNSPEGEEAKKKAKEDIEETASDMVTPDQVLAKIKEVRDAMGKIRENKERFVSLLPPEKREAEERGLSALFDKFAKDMTDLLEAEKDVIVLRDWEKPKLVSNDDKNTLANKYNFAEIGTYADTMNQSQITVLDSQNKTKRNEVLTELVDLVASHFEPITEVSKVLEDEVLKKDDAESKTQGPGQMTMLGWVKKTFGSDGGVYWLSVFDLVKIYNIYKDAIVERYHSKQKIRTYQAAQKWNIWSPLQPDLDKQAKSANDEETEKFKEYLKKDGFTYNQLFDPGGVLDANRGNINRAKAVIDYAADHAWLYKLDRQNGNDVYGVDYEGNWGLRTFEELVENNAAQQDKESKNGYSKVNNYPEIPMIIDDMIDELRKKNLWQVHGMMLRLQEKAKYAESNAMALTTLYRALREDPEVLELIDIGMLDKIGNIGIGQSAWALTLYKVQRKQILAMKNAVAKIPSREGKIAAAKSYSDSDESFVMGRAIKAIESRLPDRMKHKVDNKGRPDFRELDHEVAKVLAGQTVSDKNGMPLSIFDSQIKEFNAYREFYMDYTDTTPTEVKKTDPDFFNPANGGSDLLLLGQNEIGNIFSHQSQGPWIDENKALNFATQIFMRDEDLMRQDPSGRMLRQFRKDMQKKLSLYLNIKLTQDAAKKYLATVRTPPNPGACKGVNPKKLAGKLVLLEMKKRGYIEESIFKKIRNSAAKEMTESTLAEYSKDDPSFPPSK